MNKILKSQNMSTKKNCSKNIWKINTNPSQDHPISKNKLITSKIYCKKENRFFISKNKEKIFLKSDSKTNIKIAKKFFLRKILFLFNKNLNPSIEILKSK
jgi:hypothetical protein